MARTDQYTTFIAASVIHGSVPRGLQADVFVATAILGVVRLTVRYHAAARELAETSSEELTFESSSLMQDALRASLSDRHPALRDYLPKMRLAVNGDFADADLVLKDDDEVDVLPPVAGGSAVSAEHRVLLAEITTEPIEPEALRTMVAHSSAGGVAVFCGVVRDHADGIQVAKLRYEAHIELAEKEMHRIALDLCNQEAGVRIAAAHRIGDLDIGDIAVVVAVSSAHRAEAFDVCRSAIDRIKETVPIWKKEWAVDGAAKWVNLE